MSEPISHSLPIVGGLLRLAGALVGKKPDLPKRNLRSRITMQGIVTELPDDFPLKIVDEEGRTHRGVYALEVLIWNCGTEQIEPSDFVENAPLRVALSSDSYVIKSEAISDAKELKYEVQRLDEQTLQISADCINPTDNISVLIFYGGDPLPQVKIMGRVRGQSTSLDHNASEVKATFAERFANCLALVFMLNMIVGAPVAGAYIWYYYGFAEYLKTNPNIPPALTLSFIFGMGFVLLFAVTRIHTYFERRNYPPGFPLQSDFEPPLWESIKGMCRTAFFGEKLRFSNSLFSWAKPVKFRHSKMKRTSVDDWMH